MKQVGEHDWQYLLCPLCGKNFQQSFDCDHDEFDLADRIRELEADKAKIQKDFDLLLVRDTANLKRLIDAQAQLEAMSNALQINQTLSDKQIKKLEAERDDYRDRARKTIHTALSEEIIELERKNKYWRDAYTGLEEIFHDVRKDAEAQLASP
jgi:ABC-type phosphate transport system auxiliary subunit